MIPDFPSFQYRFEKQTVIFLIIDNKDFHISDFFRNIQWRFNFLFYLVFVTNHIREMTGNFGSLVLPADTLNGTIVQFNKFFNY